jgi:hypothetical protein
VADGHAHLLTRNGAFHIPTGSNRFADSYPVTATIICRKYGRMPPNRGWAGRPRRVLLARHGKISLGTLTSRFGNDIWPRRLSQRVVYNCCQPLRQCLSPKLRRVLFLKTKKCPSWEALTPEHCHHDHAPAVTPETRVFVQLRPHAPCCDARQQTLDGPVKMPTGP